MYERSYRNEVIMTTPLIILTIILFVLQSLSLKLVKADTLAEKLLFHPICRRFGRRVMPALP